MASNNAGKPKAKGGGLVGLAGGIAAVTLVACGGGYITGTRIVAMAKASVDAAKPEPKAASTIAVRELPPIVANLAAPEGVWVRLQTAIVFDKADAPTMDITAARIAEDTMAYVKTLTVTQLQGAAGLDHLREDLNDRAAMRSDGKVKDVMIEALVIE